MANKTFNTRVKNKRDTAANWEAVATTFQPLDGELIIVDTSAGKTRFKVGRYDTAKGRLLYYNEIPFADEYLYNDLNESQGKIYDKLKGIDDKSIIEMTLEPSTGTAAVKQYNIGIWQFPKTGFYKIKLSQLGTNITFLRLYARKTKDDGTLPEDDFSNDNLVLTSGAGGDGQLEYIYILADYLDIDSLTAYKIQFLNPILKQGITWVNTYDKTTQKWSFASAANVNAKNVSSNLTLTKGDTKTVYDGSVAREISIPTKTSELTNDSNFTTQTDLDNLTNTVVSYNAQENITDEQKAQARTNIGAISSSELVQSDWNQNDTTAKDYIKNKSLEVPYWEEFGTWTTTYSSFEDDGYLAMNAANAILCLEVNNTRFENLTYTSGSYGSFTLGDIDTIGVKISNSGMGSSTNSLTVSETMFPDGVTSAHIYRKSLKKLPLDALPDEIDWVKTIDGDSIVTKNNVDFVKSNSVFGTKQVHADNSSPDFDSTIRNAMLYRQPTNYTIPTSVKVKTFSSTSTLALKHPDDNGRYVNTEEMPYGNTLVGVDFSGKPVLLNPRRPIATSITSSSTNIQYAGAKAVYDYVETAIPTVDNALSDTSTNPVQNKVVKAAIDNKIEDFKIAATVDSNKNVTLDKTYDEIKAAIESGKNVYLLQRNTLSDGIVNNIKYYYYATINNNIVFYLGMFAQLNEYAATENVFVMVNSTNVRVIDMRIPSLEYVDSEIQGIPLPDTELSITSENPVQNKVITTEIQTINNKLGGLTGAMHFIGKATVDITDGSTTDPQIANYTTKEKGDVILGKDDHKEFVWNGATWEELGDEGSYALKTTTINGKALSGNITLTASDVGAASASTIETMQAAIDSKPSPADAVYTATAASTDGVAYTATVSGIDSLIVGASFIMIPNKASTSKAPTLNVNGLGAKPIRRRLSSLTTSLQQGYSTNWIALNKPFTVVYDGTAWVIEGLTKTDGADVYGAVAQATADAKGNNIADTYATIAMLQSLLPKVTTITLTSNWVGDASPYYQDIALSCVTETSIVDLQPTPEQLNSWQDDGIAFTTLSGNGTVRVYVAGGKPSSAISVQIRVQEVTVI